MRILHTSDLHLQEDDSKTLEALKEILKVAERRKVDLVTVGGDLFDSEEDAEMLRPGLRDIFADNDFKVLAVPGNHDQEAYSRNLDFGPDLRIATEKPFETLEYEGFSVVAVPFTNELTSGLYTGLKGASEDLKQVILLLHCTLDIGCSPKDFGDEKAWAYFPVSHAALSDWGYDYVLSGHFHTEFTVRNLENGGKFVYPGSPVSLSWKELGRRRSALIDLNDGTLEGIPIATFYRDRFEEKVRPGEEGELIENLTEWAGERSEDDCQLEVAPEGHIKIDETVFGKSLEEACGEAEIVREGYRNVEEVLSHPLFRRFKDRLESKEDFDDKEAVESKTIEAMSRLISRRELRS